MDFLIKVIAPVGKYDFLLKLAICVLVCGGIHHLRDVYFDGAHMALTYAENLKEASFTAIPMGAFGLFLISKLNALQLELYNKSMRDPLTGLPNRRWFMEKTPSWIEPDVALLIIDIDHFKRLNDRMGHDAGDLCLKDVAHHLRLVLGPHRICARIGGEEFAALVNGSDMSQLRKIAEQISKGFTFTVENAPQIRVTASVGIAMNPEGQSREKAMKEADLATYAAKDQGRAQFQLRGQLQ